MAQSFCPHCGFGNSYAYTKPTTCSKCKRSLSFEVKNFNTQPNIITSSSQIPVLTTAEKSFISKNKDTMLPIEICKRIFGEQVSSVGPEMSAIREFLNGIGQGVSPQKPRDQGGPRQIIIDDNYIPSDNDYEGDDENDNISSNTLPNIKSLSFTVDTGPAATSMSIEDAVFKYAMRPDQKPEKLKKPKGFNAKKELTRIRQEASSLSKKTKTIGVSINRED